MKSMSYSAVGLFVGVVLHLPLLLCVLGGDVLWVYGLFFKVCNTPVYLVVVLDLVGVVTAFTVLFVAANVVMFANLYMVGVKEIARFNMLVNIFVGSMLLLVYSPSAMNMILGWDGLGMSSFLLITFYQTSSSASSGMFTAVVNRIGDAAFLVVLCLLFSVNHWDSNSDWYQANGVAVFLFITAITKSAQVPFSSWLPAAMAAPTPVSALVHSSTLVTAGVFLLIRFNGFLQSQPYYSCVLMVFSCITMCLAASNASAEWDMKKVIALSTLSQLGVMCFALSLGLSVLALLHLVTHAMFKALLFICAGNIILHSSHSQDMRQMGYMFKKLPMTCVAMLIASLSLAGAPFLSGFYSKDLIIDYAMSSPGNFCMIFLMGVSTVVTGYYSFRVNLCVLWGPDNGNPMMSSVVYTRLLSIPLVLLGLGALVGGGGLGWVLYPMVRAQVFNLEVKTLPTSAFVLGCLLLAGVWWSDSVWSSSPRVDVWMLVESLCTSLWLITPVTTQFILLFVDGGCGLYECLDLGWMELVSAKGVSRFAQKIVDLLATSQMWSADKMIHLSFVVFFMFLLVL